MKSKESILMGALVTFLVFGRANTAMACFWITGTTYGGHPKRASGVGAATYLRSYLKVNHREEGMLIQSSLANSTNFNERSDYAVSLVYLGKTAEAVELLQTLENVQPGTYIVAANLGTALELQGNNEEAMKWISEAIRRNSQSHDGTEWLHVKILEAKIAAERDKNFFKNHSVLELDPKDVISGITIDGRSLSPTELGKAIEYQLQERLQFVKPPDPAVASLLFDYAAIEAATNILESAKGLLKMAVEYGYPTERVEAEIKKYDRKIAQRKTEQYVGRALLTLLACGLLYVLYKGGIFVLSSKDIQNRSATTDRGRKNFDR